jgi:hypothetical protein
MTWIYGRSVTIVAGLDVAGAGEDGKVRAVVGFLGAVVV